MILIWQRRLVPSVEIGQWLPPPQADFQEVVDAFATLRNLQPSGLQSQQANQLFMEQLERRHERYAIELDMWWTTAIRQAFSATYCSPCLASASRCASSTHGSGKLSSSPVAYFLPRRSLQ